MPTAQEQAQRNEELLAAHAAGESVAQMAVRFGLSKSRIKQILRLGAAVVEGDARKAVPAAVRR